MTRVFIIIAHIHSVMELAIAHQISLLLSLCLLVATSLNDVAAYLLIHAEFVMWAIDKKKFCKSFVQPLEFKKPSYYSYGSFTLCWCLWFYGRKKMNNYS